VISKANFSGSFWPRGQDIDFLFFTHSAKPMTGSSSESKLSASSTNDTFYSKPFLVQKPLCLDQKFSAPNDSNFQTLEKHIYL